MSMSEESIGTIAREGPEFVIGDMLEILDHGSFYRLIDNDRFLSSFREVAPHFYVTILKLAQTKDKPAVFAELLEKSTNWRVL